MEAYSLLYDFVFKQVMELVLFTYENHLIKAFWFILDTEVTCAKIMPSSFTI